MKTDYVLRRRALLGISALFCSTLLLFGCQDGANPVEPELDSPVASETAGVTFAAKKPGSQLGTLSLADGMQAGPFDVGFEVKDGRLKISNDSNNITSKPTIQLNFMEDPNDLCVGIKQTNGGTAPEPGDPDFIALLEQLTANAVDVTAVIGIDLANLGEPFAPGHSFLFVYGDKRSIKLPSRHGTVTEVPPASNVFVFTGAVVVRKGGKGIKAQRAIRCPGQRVELTFNPNP